MRKIKVNSIEDYRDTVLWLFEKGCEPSAYNRTDKIVRFHVTRAGNFWEDGESLFKACERAVNNWIEAGMPKEG